MVDITIFEVHVDEIELMANAPFSGRKGDKDESEGSLGRGTFGSGSEGAAGAGGGGRRKLRVLALLAFVVIAAIVLRKFRETELEADVDVASAVEDTKSIDITD